MTPSRTFPKPPIRWEYVEYQSICGHFKQERASNVCCDRDRPPELRLPEVLDCHPGLAHRFAAVGEFGPGGRRLYRRPIRVKGV